MLASAEVKGSLPEAVEAAVLVVALVVVALAVVVLQEVGSFAINLSLLPEKTLII